MLAAGMSPALAVAITDSGHTVVARTYGAASPDRLWPIASIGKSFTAVVALQLAEEGLLDLHAPVSDYVPWLTLGSSSAPITLHHLLTHTAGVIETSDLAPASTYDVIALADRVRAGRAPPLLGHRLSGGRRRAGGGHRRAVRGSAPAPGARADRAAQQHSCDAAQHAQATGRGPRAVLRRPSLAARARPGARTMGRVRRGRRVRVLLGRGPRRLRRLREITGQRSASLNAASRSVCRKA